MENQNFSASTCKSDTVTKRKDVDSPRSSSQKSSPVELVSEVRSSLSDVMNNLVIRKCPRVSCKEKIVICIDLSPEVNSVVFKSRAGEKFAALKLMRRAIGIFVWTKHRMNASHEFAIMALHDRAVWLQDFTNNPADVLAFLDGVQHTSFEESGDSFDLSSILDQTLKRVKLEDVESGVTPSFVLRFIIFYGRSHCLPEIGDKELYDTVRNMSQVFMDVFYIHEPPSADNKCMEIFDRLCALDQDGLSYIFETSKNLTKVYDYTAQLSAHPAQRPLQRDALLKLKASSA